MSLTGPAYKPKVVFARFNSLCHQLYYNEPVDTVLILGNLQIELTAQRNFCYCLTGHLLEGLLKPQLSKCFTISMGAETTNRKIMKCHMFKRHHWIYRTTLFLRQFLFLLIRSSQVSTEKKKIAIGDWRHLWIGRKTNRCRVSYSNEIRRIISFGMGCIPAPAPRWYHRHCCHGPRFLL